MNIIHSHSKDREVKIFTTFLFQKNMKGIESYIVIKLCNNYFLLSHRIKVLKFWSMRVTKTLLILIQRKKVSDSDPYFQEPSKQAKYQFNSSMLDDQSDDIPFHFCHI